MSELRASPSFESPLSAWLAHHKLIMKMMKGLMMKQLTMQMEYNRKYLSSLSCKELAEILKKNGLKIGNRRKANIIDKIEKCCNIASSHSKELLEKIEAQPFNTNPLHYEFYKATFNPVDLHNKIWYDFHYSCSVKNWRAKSTLSILSEDIANACSLFNELAPNSCQQFRKEIAKRLLTLKREDMNIYNL